VSVRFERERERERERLKIPREKVKDHGQVLKNPKEQNKRLRDAFSLFRDL